MYSPAGLKIVHVILLPEAVKMELNFTALYSRNKIRIMQIEGFIMRKSCVRLRIEEYISFEVS